MAGTTLRATVPVPGKDAPEDPGRGRRADERLRSWGLPHKTHLGATPYSCADDAGSRPGDTVHVHWAHDRLPRVGSTTVPPVPETV